MFETTSRHLHSIIEAVSILVLQDVHVRKPCCDDAQYLRVEIATNSEGSWVWSREEDKRAPKEMDVE